MNLGQLRAKVQTYMNVNSSQLPDDLTTANWNSFINDGYKNLWLRVRAQVSRSNLLASIDLTWPAGSQTFTLPANLQDAAIYDMWQVDSSGNPLIQFCGFFETRNVLRLPMWPQGFQGFTLRVYYIPETEDMANDSDSPSLIPASHQEVIVWEALKIVKILLDKAIPDSWVRRCDDVEFVLVKELATRPISSRSNIKLATNQMNRPLA